jgi:hypothetical protein
VTGEETAVLQYLARGVAKPTFVPPRPYERGLHGRPTLVQNSETLCQLALIARFGSDWFRELGSDADRGSALVTISGAVMTPGVYELAFGTPPAAPPNRSRRCSSAAISGRGSSRRARSVFVCRARSCARPAARLAPEC